MIEHVSDEVKGGLAGNLWVFAYNLETFKFVENLLHVIEFSHYLQCFHWSAYLGSIETMEYLLTKGVLQPPDPHLAWNIAVKANNIASLRFLALHDRDNHRGIRAAHDQAIEYTDGSRAEVVAFLRTLFFAINSPYRP